MRGATPVQRQLAQAIAKSNRLMAEDILRETGYMLPQSRNPHDLLQEILGNPPSRHFLAEDVKRLLELITCNES